MQNPIAEFFSTNDFAQDAILTDSDGARTIRIIFDQAFSNMVIGRDSFESTYPLAHCKTSDVEDVDNTCTLEVDGVTYYVQRTEFDVTGITKLILSTDAP